MKSAEYDLVFIEAGLEELDEYLLSNDVFWPLGVKPPAGQPDYPQLTLDWLLLASARLAGRRLTSDQEARLGKATSRLDMERTKWRVAWEKKAGLCYQVRRRMWGDFLQEYRENPADNANRYSYEVRLRVMLELSKDEVKLDQTEIELLTGVDGYLKKILEPGDFVWEPEVQAGFPVGKYWFLYGKLSASGVK